MHKWFGAAFGAVYIHEVNHVLDLPPSFKHTVMTNAWSFKSTQLSCPGLDSLKREASRDRPTGAGLSVPWAQDLKRWGGLPGHLHSAAAQCHNSPWAMEKANFAELQGFAEGFLIGFLIALLSPLGCLLSCLSSFPCLTGHLEQRRAAGPLGIM